MSKFRAMQILNPPLHWKLRSTLLDYISWYFSDSSLFSINLFKTLKTWLKLLKRHFETNLGTLSSFKTRPNSSSRLKTFLEVFKLHINLFGALEDYSRLNQDLVRFRSMSRIFINSSELLLTSSRLFFKVIEDWSRLRKFHENSLRFV